MTGRGLRGRRYAQLMLFATIAADVFLVLLRVPGPSFIGPMTAEPPSPLIWSLPAVGILIHVAGLAWMVRIVRADPERGLTSWRAMHRS